MSMCTRRCSQLSSLLYPMLQLDARIPEESLCQFASQFPTLPKPLQNLLLEAYVGNETPDFYQGLAAGLAAAYQMAGELEGRHYIGASLAKIAEHIVKS